MKTKRIKVITNLDRPHITYDILSVLYKYDIEILMMEVYTYVIYLKLPIIEQELWDKIVNEFHNIKGFETIEEIDLIAFEERDIEMKRVLDIVPQGVIVLNGTGNIKYANDYVAERIFKTTSNKLNNNHITKYIKVEDLKTFPQNQGQLKSINNKEISIGNQLYMLNLNPLLSNENVFTGYILSLNSIINQNVFDNHITFKDIIGESNKMYEVVNQAKLYATSDSPVLITGESGTGKELFARSIHNLSNRRTKPFIAINCAAIPEQLLESELFGYEEGSFTGGKKNGKKGIFELAEGGTVFLDEIGEMPHHLQSKLLRVLQEKSIRRIGGHRESPIDVRIISATNQDINKLVHNNEFRLDLLYRINIFNIEIPSLRERKEDIPILVEYFIENHSRRYGKNVSGIGPSAMDKLFAYDWPGNIRELQNIIERAVALTEGHTIEEKDIIINNGLEPLKKIPKASSLKDIVGEVEREVIVKALRESKSIRAAARKVEVTHTLLINRIKKYEILDEEWKA